MQPRENALHQWLKTVFPEDNYTLTPLAGDASFRRYYRLQNHNLTHIVMDAPPDKIQLEPFVRIRDLLAEQGLHAPHIHALDHSLGFAILEDFGDLLFSEALKQYPEPTALYQKAIEVLQQMQTQTSPAQLTSFDQTFMLNELARFQEWFLDRYLGLTLAADEQALLTKTFQKLTQYIAQQPQVFMHRDYHSRNIMVLDAPPTPKKFGILDFQDAMQGPMTYDLVSLLKDCYIQLPYDQMQELVKYYYDHSQFTQTLSYEQFQQAFDWCGLQRHLKVLGNFCWLHIRDGKSGYLKDLPLTYQYVTNCLKIYPEFKDFSYWLQNRVEKAFLSKHS